MKRLLAGLVLLATACSGGSAREARPSATAAPVTATPSGAPTTPAVATPSASPAAAPIAVGPPGGPVPDSFSPQSATFVSEHTGWVLGFGGCLTGRGECLMVARTRDAGRTWRAFLGPQAQALDVARIRFANLQDGFVTGSQLWRTRDGGATWSVVPGRRNVGQLEAARGRAWLLDGTSLLSTPVAGGAFAAEAVLRDPGQLVVHGTLALVGERSTGALVLAEHGRQSRTVRTPCQAGDDPVVGVRDERRWLLVCAGEPGAGQQPKTSWRTTDGGAHWTRAGDPPGRTGTWVSVTDAGDHVFDNGGASVSRDGDRSWAQDLTASGGVTEGGFVSAALGYVIGGFGGDSGGSDVVLLLHRAGAWTRVAF